MPGVDDGGQVDSRHVVTVAAYNRIGINLLIKISSLVIGTESGRMSLSIFTFKNQVNLTVRWTLPLTVTVPAILSTSSGHFEVHKRNSRIQMELAGIVFCENNII